MVRIVNDPNKILYKCRGVVCHWSIRAIEVIIGNNNNNKTNTREAIHATNW